MFTTKFATKRTRISWISSYTYQRNGPFYIKRPINLQLVSYATSYTSSCRTVYISQQYRAPVVSGQSLASRP